MNERAPTPLTREQAAEVYADCLRFADWNLEAENFSPRAAALHEMAALTLHGKFDLPFSYGYVPQPDQAANVLRASRVERQDAREVTATADKDGREQGVISFQFEVIQMPIPPCPWKIDRIEERATLGQDDLQALAENSREEAERWRGRGQEDLAEGFEDVADRASRELLSSEVKP